jgi:hypothetical protein
LRWIAPNYRPRIHIAKDGGSCTHNGAFANYYARSDECSCPYERIFSDRDLGYDQGSRWVREIMSSTA